VCVGVKREEESNGGKKEKKWNKDETKWKKVRSSLHFSLTEEEKENGRERGRGRSPRERDRAWRGLKKKWWKSERDYWAWEWRFCRISRRRSWFQCAPWLGFWIFVVVLLFEKSKEGRRNERLEVAEMREMEEEAEMELGIAQAIEHQKHNSNQFRRPLHLPNRLQSWEFVTSSVFIIQYNQILLTYNSELGFDYLRDIKVDGSVDSVRKPWKRRFSDLREILAQKKLVDYEFD
jgi:hypothetical protein